MKAIRPGKLLIVAIVTGFVAALFALLIVVFHQEEKKRIAAESHDLLVDVSNSKQKMLTAWVSEELKDVGLIIKNTNLIELTNGFVEGTLDESSLVAVFNQIKSEHDYAELVFQNNDGEYLTSTNHALTFNDSIDRDIMVRALRTDSSYVSDIYRSSVDHYVYIDIVSVIRNKYGKPIGGIVFKMHPYEMIDRMLSDWEIAGYRGMTTIIQQKPGSTWMEYKPDKSFSSNQSCWQPIPSRFKNAPLNPRLSMVRVKAIPNTHWYLMVELDNSKHKVNVNKSVTLLSIISVLSILLIFFGLLFIVYNQEKSYSIELKERKLELERIKNYFRFILDMLNEAVVLTNAQGQIEFMNLSAELFSGWSFNEVEGKPLDNYLPLLQEETGISILTMKNWFSGEHSFNQYMVATLIDKSGTHVRVVCSIAPLRRENSNMNGLAIVMIKDNKS